MPDCSSITCCPDGSYGYQIPSDNPDIPVIPSYTLSLTVDPLGYGAVTGEGDYPQSTFAQIQAYPDTGKYFVNWTGDYSGTENPANIFMDGNKSIQANFAASQLSLQLFNDPEDGGTTTGQGVYTYGDTANIEATAASGYEFSGWTGGVTTSDNPHDFIITENTQITANYTQLEFELELSVSPADSGFVSGDGSYASGATANISASPADGYAFDSWSGDASGTSAATTVLMDRNKSAVANFVLKDCVEPYVLMLCLDQTVSIGIEGAAAGINIIDNTNIYAVGIVAFGDEARYLYPLTTDLASVRAYLSNAISVYDGTYPNPLSTFWFDYGSETPENGVDALALSLANIVPYVAPGGQPKAIYFKTDTAGYDHETNTPSVVNSSLNGPDMAFTFLEFGNLEDGSESGFYADTFPETEKVGWKAFPDCS